MNNNFYEQKNTRENLKQKVFEKNLYDKYSQ